MPDWLGRMLRAVYRDQSTKESLRSIEAIADRIDRRTETVHTMATALGDIVARID